MKIYLFTAKGDELLADVSIIEEAEKILKEYRQKGCMVLDREGSQIDLASPLPEEVYLLWPMSGGSWDDLGDPWDDEGFGPWDN